MNRTRNAFAAASVALGSFVALAACGGGGAEGPPSPDSGAPDGPPDGPSTGDDAGSLDARADGSDGSPFRDSGPDAAQDALGPDTGSDASMLPEVGVPDAGLACDGGSHVCDGTSGPFCAIDTSPDTCGSSCMACYEPANGTATCNGTTCGYTCNTGYSVCAGGCCSCGPTGTCVIAQNQSNALAIAADDVNVYWTTSGSSGETGSIQQASVGGGQATVLYSAVDESPNAIAVSAGNVFFDTFNLGTDEGRVMQVPIGGGTTVGLFIGGLDEWPTGLAIANGTAYFQDYLPTFVEPDGGPVGTANVFSVATDGAVSPNLLATNQTETNFSGVVVVGPAVAVGTNALYFTDGLNADVLEVPLGGGTVTTFAAAQHATALATDANNVYWTTAPSGPNGTVLQEPLAGGPIVTLASNQNDPDAISVDTANVYFATGAGGSGTIVTVPIGGGSATTLVTAQSEPVGIALNSTRVFWVTYGDGKIQSVPK